MSQLFDSRCYLAGPIDRCPNLGVEWRLWISDILEDRWGVIPYNPMNKPIFIADEFEGRERRKEWKETGQYDKLAEFVKLIRRVDLRMTDKADFGIFFVDTEIHMCGTYEEISWMNRCKKPCLVMCKQGVVGVPDWLFGVIPHQHMFGNWDDLFTYLDKIDQGFDDGTDRWLIFQY